MIRMEYVGPQRPDKPNVSFPLLTEKTYTLGRKVADITFPDDSSISRSHAHIIVEHPAGNITEPLLTPVMTVVDLGSKFGTYATADNIKDNHAATPRDKITLSIGDRIRFGLQWNEFQLSYTPFVVTTSSFKATQEFKDKIVKLGGHCVSEWDEAVTHVVMESLSLTVKVVCALLSAKPIVTPGFIYDLVSSFETNKPSPVPTNYLPPIGEREISSIDESDLYPKAERTMLFGGKTFLFFSTKHMKKLASAIKAGGGTVKTVLEACQDNVANSQFIIMANPTDVTNAEKDGKLKAILELYKKAGKRCVQDSEVGLAAVYTSLDKFCNPFHNMKGSVLPTMRSQTQSSSSSAQLAQETQELLTQRSSPGNDTSRRVVDESRETLDQSDDRDEADIIEVSIPTSPSRVNGKRRVEGESSSMSSKKRSAAETLAGPDSKRLRETSNSCSSKSISPEKPDSSRVLKSLFNFSDSEDEDDQSSSRVNVPESRAEASASRNNETTIARDSQLPKVNVVPIRKLQSISRTQDSMEEEEVFRVPASPPPAGMADEPRAVINPGTDDVETVRSSVMNAITLPVSNQAPETVRATRSRANKRIPDPEEGTSSGGRKRRREDEEKNDDEDKLAEKARKLDIREETKSTSEDVEPKIVPLPLIRKPLINPNLSRLETTLLINNSNVGKGVKNFKCFKKVLPAFLTNSPASSGQSRNDSRTRNLNSSIISLRSSKPIRLVVRDFYPGATGNYPLIGGQVGDDDDEDGVPQFEPLEDLFAEPGPSAAQAKTSKGKNGKDAKSGKEDESSSSQRRTSPRKRSTQNTSAMPPPPVPVPTFSQDDDEDDMWSFK